MQTSCIASGFLYHSPSQQILLQQHKNGDDVKLVLFGNKSKNGEDPKVVFQRTMEDVLGFPIPVEAIHPVYDYTHDKFGEQFIFFVEVADLVPEDFEGKENAAWLMLTKLAKSNMSEQTRHDIIVAERVIRSIFETANPQPQKRH